MFLEKTGLKSTHILKSSWVLEEIFLDFAEQKKGLGKEDNITWSGEFL